MLRHFGKSNGKPQSDPEPTLEPRKLHESGSNPMCSSDRWRRRKNSDQVYPLGRPEHLGPNDSNKEVIWVANRQKPLNDSSGVLTISEDDNLVVSNGQKEILWSSSVNNSVANSSAQLLDLGNLVLKDNTTGTILWESFKHPSHTMLPDMKISANERTCEKVQLTSWKSPSDPSIGSFSFEIFRQSLSQAFIWKDDRPYFRFGPWNGQELHWSTKISSIS
nr:g-type lectin s-receptor-like serine/threonine-protein kinase [Quercus suber]